MSSFPDTWAMGKEFLVLPLSKYSQSWQQVLLGGITGDPDDLYPPLRSHNPLYLSRDTHQLFIVFHGIGAYRRVLVSKNLP